MAADDFSNVEGGFSLDSWGQATPLKPTKAEVWAKILEKLRGGLNFGTELKSTYPSAGLDRGLTRGVGLGDLLVGDAPESWDKEAYNSAFTQYGRVPLPVAKPGRAADVVNMASTLPLDPAMAGQGPLMVGAVRKHGDIVSEKVAKTLAETIKPAEGAQAVNDALLQKTAQWITRSAGKDEPAFKGLLTLATPPPGKEGMVDTYDAFNYLRDLDFVTPQKFSGERGLPPAPGKSMQEVFDAFMLNPLQYGDKAEQLQRGKKAIGKVYPWEAEKVGMSTEQFEKLIPLLSEDAIVGQARLGPLDTHTEQAKLQINELAKWLSSKPPEEQAKLLEKSNVPALFKARDNDMKIAMREWEKGQVGKVEMKFPDGWQWQRLEAKHLDREAKEMGRNSHFCVANYKGEVECGEMEVYSLRDAKNKPAVTLGVQKIEEPGEIIGPELYRRLTTDEITEIETAYEQFYPNFHSIPQRDVKSYIETEFPANRVAKIFSHEPRWEIFQIKAEGNRVPAKYMKQIQEFMDKKGWDYQDSYEWEQIVNANDPAQVARRQAIEGDNLDFPDPAWEPEGNVEAPPLNAVVNPNPVELPDFVLNERGAPEFYEGFVTNNHAFASFRDDLRRQRVYSLVDGEVYEYDLESIMDGAPRALHRVENVDPGFRARLNNLLQELLDQRVGN